MWIGLVLYCILLSFNISNWYFPYLSRKWSNLCYFRWKPVSSGGSHNGYYLCLLAGWCGPLFDNHVVLWKTLPRRVWHSPKMVFPLLGMNTYWYLSLYIHVSMKSLINYPFLLFLWQTHILYHYIRFQITIFITPFFWTINYISRFASTVAVLLVQLQQINLQRST